MSVGEIASALRLTHVSISQARRSLEAKGFVHSLPDGKDARRRPIALTAKGEALTRELAGLWQVLGDSAAELNAEAGDLIPLLDRLDDALAERSLLDRALAHAARP
jgi:DNA-binding MarR family transcriptional regulator